MEVKNGIIIDGVLHEMEGIKGNDCLRCSLRDLCNEFVNSAPCWINILLEAEITNVEFKCRGKVTNIEIEEVKL